MSNSEIHLQDELSQSTARITVQTRFGPVTGGKAINGTSVFLEIPYALPPGRFEDPKPLPDSYVYEAKEYIYERSYGAQPRNDGQAASMRFEDKVGLGQPTENPLFSNIYVPPSYPAQKDFPVKVYIHGGFLQFGSPHTCSSQPHGVADARSEIWVNIGYRLSAFGFLASEKHGLSGNYGFKDQWLALEWIKSNISAFGGSPDNIQVTGLSAGAHSVHQLLHHASQLPKGVQAPFASAVLQSNAILTDPKTPEELEPQFEALCRALGLDPGDDNVLTLLKDYSTIAASSITNVIEQEVLGEYGTFRGCLSPDWILGFPGPMERQRKGTFAKGLLKSGVKFVVVGEVCDEWYLYSIAHPVHRVEDIKPNLRRYFSHSFVDRLVAAMFPQPTEGLGLEETRKMFGEILSAAQVYLPVRVLAHDLKRAGYPVLRYEIRWAPEKCSLIQKCLVGYVTHGTDRPVWTMRSASLTRFQEDVAKLWLDAIDAESRAAQNSAEPCRSASDVLVLQPDTIIQWEKDGRWDMYERFHTSILL